MRPVLRRSQERVELGDPAEEAGRKDPAEVGSLEEDSLGAAGIHPGEHCTVHEEDRIGPGEVDHIVLGEPGRIVLGEPGHIVPEEAVRIGLGAVDRTGLVEAAHTVPEVADRTAAAAVRTGPGEAGHIDPGEAGHTVPEDNPEAADPAEEVLAGDSNPEAEEDRCKPGSPVADPEGPDCRAGNPVLWSSQHVSRPKEGIDIRWWGL